MYGRGGPPRAPYHDPRYSQSPPYPPHAQYSPMQYAPYGRGYSPPPVPYASHHASPTHGYPPQHSPYHGYPPAGASPYHQGYAAPQYASPQQYPPNPPAYPRAPIQTAPAPRVAPPRRAAGPPPGAQKTKDGHFANLSWTPKQKNDAAADKSAGSGSGTPSSAAPNGAATEDEEDNPFRPPKEMRATAEEEDNPFRPPKDMRTEDEAIAKKTAAADSEKMPPPAKTSEGDAGKTSISFTIKGMSDKKEIKPATPSQLRMVKEIVIRRRIKPRPELSEEHKASDSVYYRKTGNESVVGSGTYGKVYKAVHVYTKNEVALKKIRMEGERDGFPVTAIREIKLLQSLNHVNVVALHEVMVEKNDCYMIFEYLSHDLTGLLNHPTFTLSAAHKKHLALQLFEGLDYLHRRGVLHRDIKAANILVSKRGELKIADFGLARFYAKNRKQDYTNRVITIWYRSPELLLGETQYGPAVDIWSAACVLVEIFTRHAIFPGDGGEISQLDKIYGVLGTPSRSEWPAIVELQWYELLRPTTKQPSTFSEKYRDRVSPEGFDLLKALFQYDPQKRPEASDVLQHPYFTVEDPRPQQVVELADLEGDWHEFESKALRKERDREARRKEREKVEAASGGVAGGEEAQKRKESMDPQAVEGREAKRAKTAELQG